jgi:hypothetical protein
MDAPEARSSASSSPEFEFWPLYPNPAASPSCADELFAGGVLLPLPILPPKPESRNKGSGISQCVPVAEPEPEPQLGEASLLATVAPPTASMTSPAPPTASGGGGSKRWTDIFSKKPAPGAEEKDREKDKEKRKDGAGSRKQGGGHTGGAGSELNINIWPFSRSRSAGGGSGSSKPRPAARKVSSAPCSRSNSRGEAGAPPLRRWAASPGRSGGGVPVGRSSPVWQIRRPASKPAPAPAPAPGPTPSASELFSDRGAPPRQHKDKPAGVANGRKPGLSGGVRGLNLSVNSCIGYRHQVSCRRVEVGAARGPGPGLFGIKGLFSKKVH